MVNCNRELLLTNRRASKSVHPHYYTEYSPSSNNALVDKPTNVTRLSPRITSLQHSHWYNDTESIIGRNELEVDDGKRLPPHMATSIEQLQPEIPSPIREDSLRSNTSIEYYMDHHASLNGQSVWSNVVTKGAPDYANPSEIMDLEVVRQPKTERLYFNGLTYFDRDTQKRLKQFGQSWSFFHDLILKLPPKRPHLPALQRLRRRLTALFLIGYLLLLHLEKFPFPKAQRAIHTLQNR